MRSSIGTKILLGIAIVLAITAALGWYSIACLQEVSGLAERISSKDLEVLEELRQVTFARGTMRAMRLEVITAVLQRRAELPGEEPARLVAEWQAERRRAAEQLRQLERKVSGYPAVALSAERAESWRQLAGGLGEARPAQARWAEEVAAELPLVAKGDLAALAARGERVRELGDAFDATLERCVALAQAVSATGAALAHASAERARLSVMWALALAIATGVAVALSIRRSIARPLAAFMAVVERVGQGDLTQRAATSGDAELVTLGVSINQMVDGLREMSGQLRAATENLSASSAEIVASTQQQAASAAEQATAVQQTNATVAEINQSGSQISERARQVAASAEATSAASRSGAKAMQDMGRATEAIREQTESVAETIVALSERTQAVGEIIATVNDIAEQSHLLALNAAIEAAAAGEHGRSFGVVASEIKHLADQAKEATVQVRSILGEIQKGINTSVMLTEETVKRVETGKEQSQTAQTVIDEMARSIDESVRTFQQIMAATNQQQIGFEQVAVALRNIHGATEQTAAGTRQLERAAADLDALGTQLRQAVGRYRL
jgi:methyl-accepting chemotaxis protein